MGSGEGLGDALKYVGELKGKLRDRDIHEIGGRTYSYVPLHQVKEPEVEPLKMTTLSGLVDYVNSGSGDDGYAVGDMLVHVVSPTKVCIRTPVFGVFKQREILVLAEPETPKFPFDRFVENEDFIIGLNAMFLENKDRDILLRKVAHIKIEDSADIVDDGVAQKLKVASGARLVDMEEMKPRWTLQPYCSFPELTPPAREFLFRVDKQGHPGLFQADGDTWRGPHMQRIKEWLDVALNGVGDQRREPCVMVLA